MLYDAKIETAPPFLSRNWIWHTISFHYSILCCAVLYYTLFYEGRGAVHISSKKVDLAYPFHNVILFSPKVEAAFPPLTRWIWHHPRTALYYTILYYIILYYTILYYNILHYTTLDDDDG